MTQDDKQDQTERNEEKSGTWPAESGGIKGDATTGPGGIGGPQGNIGTGD